MKTTKTNILKSDIPIKGISIGGDLLASLSIGMYNQPLDIYREFVQNAVDAYQMVETPSSQRAIDITVDRSNRTVVFRDYASGLNREEMVIQLLSVGRSRKRGYKLRGFRGIGRLAALGYCRKLIFRSRKSHLEPVIELEWDSVALHKYNANGENEDLINLLLQISTFSKFSDSTEENWPDCFFECILEGVRYTKNDALLNPTIVSSYLSEIGPVPFSKDFLLGRKIYSALGDESIFEVNIYINGSEQPIMRPHRNQIISGDGSSILSTVRGLREIVDLKEVLDSEGNPLARGWILDHDYPGALPISSYVRGLRIRIGNIQVGDERVLDSLFKEHRFNVWCIGEVHICTPDIYPNTRRDDLEQCPQVDDLMNALRILAKKLTDTCREASLKRNKKSKLVHRNISLPSKKYRKIMEALEITEKPLPDRVTLSLDANKQQEA